MSNTSFETAGKIVQIFDTQQVSEKFRKREVILCIPDGQYPQECKFQLTQDKCDILDQYKAGDEVKVNFNLQGKAFTKNGTTNWFNNLGIWKIEKAGTSTSTTSPSSGTAATANMTVSGEEDNDLPF